jgi:hypothetical protein
MAKVEAWFTFSVEIDVDDVDSLSEIAQKGKLLLIDKINSDSIIECIEDVVELVNNEE